MRKENQGFQFSPWRISDSVLNHELICLAWLSKFPKALNKSAQARTATSRSPAVLTFPCPQLLLLVLHNPLSRQHRLLYLLLSNISAGWAAKQTLVPAQGRWQNLMSMKMLRPSSSAVREETTPTHRQKLLHVHVTIFATCLTLWI